MRYRTVVALSVVSALCTGLRLAPVARAGDAARELLGRADVRGRALVLVLGCEDKDLVLDLARGSEELFHVLDSDAAKVAACRDAAHAAGLYGSRLIIEQHGFDRLPHADRLCDAALAPGLAKGDIPEAELRRVLRPLGLAVFKDGTVFHAPQDPDPDEWNHWRRGPDNGMVSSGTVGPPFLMQWFNSDPFFAYAPNVTLVAGGRMFFVTGDMGYGARAGDQRTIYAYGAWNGRLLWKRKLPEGEPVQWPGYVATVGAFYQASDKGCFVLDPQTGQERRVLAAGAGDSTAWKCILLGEQGKRLFALLGPPDPPYQKQKGLQTYWGNGALPEAEKWGDTLVALDLGAAEPTVAWSHKLPHRVNGRTLAMSHGRIFYQARGEHVGGIDAASGKTLWVNADPEVVRVVDEPVKLGGGTFAPDASGVATESAYITLWRRQNVVALSSKDGKMLWSRPAGRRVLVFPDHVLVHVSQPPEPKTGAVKGAWMRIDPATGKELGHLMSSARGVETPLRSGSCTVDVANARFLYQSRRLVVYDLEKKTLLNLQSVRSSCTTGTTLAHGLAFVTPTFCRCGYLLDGVRVFAPAGDFNFGQEAKGPERLEAASREAVKPFAIDAKDWPTYRASSARTACTAAQAPGTAPKQVWEHRAASGLPLTAPVAAGGMVFLGGADGVVRALDAATGAPRWAACTAGPA